MKTFKEINKGDFVQLKDIDLIINNYLSENNVNNIDFNHLRLLCSASEKNKYRVYNNIKLWSVIYIEIGKKLLKIKYEYLKEAIS